MKYPISHNRYIEELEAVVASWPVDKSFDDVLKWLMQFDNEDIDLAVRIVKSLNVIGFDDLNTSLSIAYSKLERAAIDRKSPISRKNTLFAGIGESGKSGAMMGYNFRVINDIPEENFLTDESLKYLEQGCIDNIVLIDDVIGTGDQATEEIKKLTEKITPFGVKNIFMLTAVGMGIGIKKILKDTKAHVFSAFEYSDLDTAKNLDSLFYEGVSHESRIKMQARLEYYGKVASEWPLGYGGIGAFISFYYNTPNISLPLIWSSRNSWIPLFKRAVKIDGISSYYKQIDSALSKRKKENTRPTQKIRELQVFVEGRIDEAFFDYVISAIESPYFEKISIVSLGGFGSRSLFENIARLSENYLFILEDDDRAPIGHLERLKKNLEGHPHIDVAPPANFLDINALRQDERWGRYARAPEGEEPKHHFLRRLDELLVTVTRRMAPGAMRDFFAAYSDRDKIEQLRTRLNEKFTEIANASITV
jgi:hypothetical protein